MAACKCRWCLKHCSWSRTHPIRRRQLQPVRDARLHMLALRGSVGLGGLNRGVDVRMVQRLLTNANVSPGAVNGRCSAQTIGAILRFQKNVLAHPDGRVDVRGPSWQRLASAPPMVQRVEQSPRSPQRSGSTHGEVFVATCERCRPVATSRSNEMRRSQGCRGSRSTASPYGY